MPLFGSCIDAVTDHAVGKPGIKNMPSESAWRPQSCLSHIITGADQLEQLNAHGGVAVAFDRLTDQPVHLAFKGTQSINCSIWSTQSDSGFVAHPKVSFDLITIRFVTGGFMSRRTSRGGDILVRFDQALFTSFDEMRIERASPGFAAITVAISRSSLFDAYRAMDVRCSMTAFRPNRVVDLRSIAIMSLRNSLLVLRDQPPVGSDAADMMTPLLQELLVYQIISAWQTTEGPDDRPIPQLTDRPVKLAIDFIEANLGCAIGIADIASAAGLSVRGLQVAFRKRMGYSPISFLIARRLDMVNAALRDDSLLTIGQIAGQWGFTHMSDFARRYRERFGHSPRVTKQCLGPTPSLVRSL